MFAKDEGTAQELVAVEDEVVEELVVVTEDEAAELLVVTEDRAAAEAGELVVVAEVGYVGR
jgi:hypothetical protein